MTNYKELNDTLNQKGVNFPATSSDVDRFEKNNNIALNVFTLSDNNRIFPYRMSEIGDGGESGIDLRLYSKDVENIDDNTMRSIEEARKETAYCVS